MKLTCIRSQLNYPKMTPLPQRTERQIRVFISSTFRDMQAEHDHLVKVDYPVLREE